MRTVLIVGGTGDLGHAVVPRLLRDYRCIVQYRSAESFARLEEAIGKHEWLTGVATIDASVAPLHALVHLAGGVGIGASVDDFTKIFETNVLPAVRSFADATPHLADGGRIVAISSIATITKPAGLAAYVASKAALNALVEVTAKELAPRRIRVNALLPDAMATPANLETTPVEKLVPTDRVAETIAFLLSDEGASVTSQLIALRP
jgi:NAD(P)-dependent dehydrogenase (short-subunit alcohol dehydrogenase family)